MQRGRSRTQIHRDVKREMQRDTHIQRHMQVCIQTRDTLSTLTPEQVCRVWGVGFRGEGYGERPDGREAAPEGPLFGCEVSAPTPAQDTTTIFSVNPQTAEHDDTFFSVHVRTADDTPAFVRTFQCQRHNATPKNTTRVSRFTNAHRSWYRACSLSFAPCGSVPATSACRASRRWAPHRCRMPACVEG